MRRRGLALAVGVVTLLSGCTSASSGPHKAADRSTVTATPTVTEVAAASNLPVKRLTPGRAVAAVTAAQVCTPGFAAKASSVPAARAKAVFAAYKVAWAGHAAYQLDHLIPVSLGGSNAAANLWPQPHAPSASLHKDQLENKLHELVCTGHLALASAQKAVRSDWVAAYGKYGGARTLTYPRPKATSSHPTERAPTPKVTTTRPPAPATTPAPTHVAPAPTTTADDHGGATALCNDGTLSYSAHHQGTCSHHGGVAIWYR